MTSLLSSTCPFGHPENFFPGNMLAERIDRPLIVLRLNFNYTENLKQVRNTVVMLPKCGITWFGI